MRTSERRGLAAVSLAALGVVFGDIRTSPLYAFKVVFGPEHGIPLTPANVFAALSMIFWTVMLIVSLKTVTLMLRFDNRGEGGVLALLSWSVNALRGRPRTTWLVTIVGAFAVSLFYGDAAITPAISVLSALEGLSIAAPALDRLVLPISIGIIVGLFLMQRSGSAAVGALFGPVMLVWFATLALLGGIAVLSNPAVLAALDPRYAMAFVIGHPELAFVAAGAVFVCVTGVVALYADMGQFGPKPIRLAWFVLVLPALTLNYFGQGALVLADPQAVRNPFYLLAPKGMVLPLVVLATAATVIASQAVITGAFSATQQASRLNFLPRLRVLHGADRMHGQVYIPLVNWLLLVVVLALMLEFRSSASLAAAYGVAVSGNLLLVSILLLVTLPLQPDARLRWLLLPFAAFAAIEAAFFAANAVKLWYGGWVPLALALAVFTVLTTWRRGTEVIRSRKDSGPKASLDGLSIDLTGIQRVPGAAIFFASSRGGCPTSFLHNLKHNGVVHETTIFLTVEFDDVPHVPDDERVQLMRGTNGVMRLIVHVGFRENPDIVDILRLAARKGLVCSVDETSYFTSKPTIVSVSRRGPFGWRRSLFGWMVRNSASVADYFKLPANRVIELGTQVAV